MERARWFLVVAVVSTLVQGDLCGQGKVRVWTDSSGREIIATLDGFENGETVILLLGDGRRVPYPVEKLSSRDQAFARQVYADRPVEERGAATIDWANPKQSENFVIRGVRRDNAPGYVSTKAGWEYGVECIEAKVQFKGKEDSAPGNIRAYFYTRDGKLIEKYDTPPRRQDMSSNYVDPPTAFEKGKVVEAYFPITPFLKDSDWATALIVFGSGSDYAVETLNPLQPGPP